MKCAKCRQKMDKIDRLALKKFKDGLCISCRAFKNLNAMKCDCGKKLVADTFAQGKPVVCEISILHCDWCGNNYCPEHKILMKNWGNTLTCPVCEPDIKHISDLEAYYAKLERKVG